MGLDGLRWPHEACCYVKGTGACRLEEPAATVCYQTEAAPVPHPPLTESFENIKSFWCMGVMERAELLQDAEVNRKGPAWAPGRANFCLHTEHLKEASAFLQTLGDCQCVVA